MNERITNLIIEANKYATEKHPISEDEQLDPIVKELIVGNRIGESQRKLAELIVRECAGLLVEEAQTNHDPDSVTQNILMFEAWWMKEHFGIKDERTN